MDTKRENVSLWLHNKLGTSNDSWISSSISSQLNKDVLKQIKDCFPDLQTQVKIKFLLAFFHIPRRLVEEVGIIFIDVFLIYTQCQPEIVSIKVFVDNGTREISGWKAIGCKFSAN